MCYPFLLSPAVFFREVHRVLLVVTRCFPERVQRLRRKRRCCIALPATRQLDGQWTRLTLDSELLHDLQSRWRNESFVVRLDRVEVSLAETRRTSISGLCNDFECRECRLRRRVRSEYAVHRLDIRLVFCTILIKEVHVLFRRSDDGVAERLVVLVVRRILSKPVQLLVDERRARTNPIFVRVETFCGVPHQSIERTQLSTNLALWVAVLRVSPSLRFLSCKRVVHGIQAACLSTFLKETVKHQTCSTRPDSCEVFGVRHVAVQHAVRFRLKDCWVARPQFFFVQTLNCLA